MAMGVPVVISVPQGEATDIVTDTGCGVVVPAADPTSLALTIKSLSEDSSKMALLKTNAIAAASLYSRDVLAMQLLDVLIGAVESPTAVVKSSPSHKINS